MTARFFQLAFALVLATTLGASFANAESSKPVVKKSVTTITTVESDGVDEETSTTDDQASDAKADDNEITTTFGSTATTGLAGCKTEELSKNVIRDLKSDCAAWMKDQKAELKDKYLTGVCEEHCSDCQMSLRRCSVKGTVRYSKANAKK